MTKRSSLPAAFKALAHPINDLVPDPRNARQHSERNIAAVKDSLQRFGWRGVVVAHKKTKVILAGNARVQAATELGWTEAPVLFVDDKSPEALRYALADNRTAELATWDFENLQQVIADIGDVDVPGFTDEELDGLLAVPAIGDETDDSEVERRNDDGQKRMVAKESTTVLKLRVPKANAETALARLAELANELGGELV